MINNSAQNAWPSQAIPIIPKSNYRNNNPNHNNHQHHHQHHQQTPYPTTPSLQSILDQKKLSNGSIRSSVSTNSVPSLVSINSASYESCDTHPLDSFNTWEDIDENFFNNEFNESIDYDTNNYTYDHNDVQYNYNFEPVLPMKPAQEEQIIDNNNNNNNNNKTINKKSSFVSNLSSSIKSFTNSTIFNNDLLLDIQPRLTDDKLPTNILRHTGHDDSIQSIHKDTELKTFKITSINNKSSTNFQGGIATSNTPSSISILKNREPRINSQFLRLYSYESNSRKKGILPEVSHMNEDEYSNQSINSSKYSKNSKSSTHEFAIHVREKLWQCVILPPREDLTLTSYKKPRYVYKNDYVSNSEKIDMIGKNNEEDENNGFVSLIRQKGDIKPWIKLEDEQQSKQKVLKPYGVLNNDVQFTVKGWCNERWLPKNA